jgi:hypothetical protein
MMRRHRRATQRIRELSGDNDRMSKDVASLLTGMRHLSAVLFRLPIDIPAASAINGSLSIDIACDVCGCFSFGYRQ